MDVRKIFYYLFSGRWFLCERLFFPSRFLFFKYVTWRFSPCGRVFLFFCLDTKEKETKRKNQGYVSGPTPERPFWRWKMNSLRCTTLRQHFSTPPVHSYAHAPTTRPIFFFTPRRFAVGFGFLLTCLRLLLFSSVYFYGDSVKYLSISHWKLCLLARNSLFLGWVYIYLT